MEVEYIAPHNNYNGYGMASRHLIKYLSKIGVTLDRNIKNAEISLIHAPAPAIDVATGRIKVLFTMIEGDKTPPSWIPYMRKADYIVVPSKFCKKVFDSEGFNCEVINLGYDPEVFVPVERTVHAPEEKPFTVLHYEAFQDRKGWDELLDAWTLSLYDRGKDVRLILKTIKPYNEIPERVKDFVDNVEVISGKLPQHAINDLLAEADVFVFPSRGEGLSHPPLEAMATGCPVILTKGHSHMDFYDERYMYGVDVSRRIPTDYPGWEKVGNYVQCKTEHLAQQLEHVYNHRGESIDKGKLAINYIKPYSYENIAWQWKRFLRNI